MGYQPVPDNVLRKIVVQRHWRTPRAFQAQFRRAACELAERETDPGLRSLSVSERQFKRWLTGVRPYPDACRVLEYMFGLPVDVLLGSAAGAVGGMDAAPVTPVDERCEGLARQACEAVVDAASVQVTVRPGVAVTVLGEHGGAGGVVVVAAGVRVLIQAAAADLAVPAVLAVAGPDGEDAEHVEGARVYSIAARRDAQVACAVCACHGNHLQRRA